MSLKINAQSSAVENDNLVILDGDTTVDNLIAMMESMLAVEFKEHDELAAADSMVKQMRLELHTAQNQLDELDAQRPMGSDVSLLKAWASKRDETDLLAQTLKERLDDDESNLAVLIGERSDVKKRIAQYVDNKLFSYSMEMQRVKNAEITELEKRLRDVQRNHAGFSHAKQLELNGGRRMKAWTRS